MRHLMIARVTQHTQISPNMIRVRLQSDSIRTFPDSAVGGHLKLIIPVPGQDEKAFSKFISSFGVRKRMRTYTVRHLHRNSSEIDIDFVAHGDDGPASAWAMSAKVGDFIGMSSPGAPKLKSARSGQYLVAVDLTAFPAAAAGIEALPADAKGDFYTEIPDEKDRQVINAPAGINMHWIVNPDISTSGQSLVRAIQSRELTGDESVFVAGEYQAVGNLRNYFRHDQAYPKDQLYISSYWKRGLIEPEHKRVKTLVA